MNGKQVIKKLEQNGWKVSKYGKPVMNPDLWQEMFDLVKPHKIQTMWVKGHNGHPENEWCDKEASLQTESIRNS